MAPKRNAALEAMIEEATVDAYNDDEQRSPRLASRARRAAVLPEASQLSLHAAGTGGHAGPSERS